MAKILLVEDDAGLCKMIKDWLGRDRYQVEVSSDGAEALEKLQFYQFDLVILDWQLPSMSGVEILKQYRQSGGLTPVLMLTGKGELTDKEEGFDAGADDYLTKPFHMKELSARIRALLRRPPTFVEALKVGSLSLDRGNCSVTKDGSEIRLLPKEFALMDFFMRHPNQIFSTEALLNRVWASESDATSEALTTTIKRLRKKLDADPKQSIIRTVHGVGYKLDI